MSYTIRYTTEDYIGNVNSFFYTEETIEKADQTFDNVCSTLRSEFYYHYMYRKVLVTLTAGDERIREYSLEDMED